nr:tetratricopeptide repeat protein [Acidobacteriota bacterium]
MTRRWRRSALAALIALGTAAGCARTVPPAVVAPGPDRYPDYPRPDVPPDLARLAASARAHNLAWAQLQGGDLRGADRTLREVLERTPSYYPSRAALGFVALARGTADVALQAFDRVLGVTPGYVPALIGRGEALLELGREGEAFESYQAVLERAPADGVAMRRVEVLRFRAVQSDVASARTAIGAGRLADARDAYDRALKASPDSGFLYRDLAEVEQRLDNDARARTLIDRAIALDDGDARALALRADLARAAGQDDVALADYRRALALDPALPEVAARINEIETGLKDAALPTEFKAIGSVARVTRGDVAALLAHRMPALLQAAAR